MGVHRSYFSHQATLLAGSAANTSRNPVIELSYGGGETLETRRFSRYVFRLDLDSLRAKMATGVIQPEQMQRHELRFTNVIGQAPSLTHTPVDDAKRAAGVRVQVFALTQDFDEGNGFDYVYGTTNPLRTPPELNAANWFYRKRHVPWATPGTFTNPPAVLASATLPTGTEDLVFDVTDYVNRVLRGECADYGLGLALSPVDESVLNRQRFVVTFYSRTTTTFFEPYLETTTDDVYYEDRDRVYLDEPAYLYLAATRPVDEVTKVLILDHESRLLYTYEGDEQIEKLRPDLYRVRVQVMRRNYPDQVRFFDQWYCKVAGVRRVIEQGFTLADRPLLMSDNVPGPELYFGVQGMRSMEVTPRGSVRRISVNIRRQLHGVLGAGLPPDALEYRLYVMNGREQLDVIPPTPLSHVGDMWFLDLDTGWLLPEYYYLQIRAVDAMAAPAHQTVRFRVVNNG